MPHYLPSDFEIDANTRTVTHKASGRKYMWHRSSEMGDATHYDHRSEGMRTFRSAIAIILSVTRSKHCERQSTLRDTRSSRKMDCHIS
jgi:hypothetical protein